MGQDLTSLGIDHPEAAWWTCPSPPCTSMPYTQRAWHRLFARNLFIQEHDRAKLARHEPQFTLIDAPAVDA